MISGYTKKVENKKCPYRDTIIIVHSGLPIYWCGLFNDKKQCIFETGPEDAGECSYYLFPEEYQKDYIICVECGFKITKGVMGGNGKTVFCPNCHRENRNTWDKWHYLEDGE